MAFDKHASPDTKQYHIQVARGEVGRYVFLPGDPFRTDLIASFLEDAKIETKYLRRNYQWLL